MQYIICVFTFDIDKQGKKHNDNFYGSYIPYISIYTAEIGDLVYHHRTPATKLMKRRIFFAAARCVRKLLSR